MSECGKKTTDSACREMLEVAETKKYETVWDRYDKTEPQCNFGKLGICCTNCMHGPCRINPFSDETQKGICGASDYTIVARNIIRSIAAGAAAHSGHGRHVADLLYKLAQGEAPDYQIVDENKMLQIAKKLGIAIDGKEKNEITKEVAIKALEDFASYDNKPLHWVSNFVTTGRKEIFEKTNTMPASINDTIADIMHRTSMGTDADPLSLIFGGLTGALSDFDGCSLATDLSDILFGTPEPVTSEANLGVLSENKVNIAVHGHEPILSEKVFAAAQKLEEQAKAAGAEAINIVGICCTGNELLMRQGIPLAGNHLSQELAIMTGALDAMVVDVQCFMPSLRIAAECFSTEIITTMPIAKIPGAYHIQFREEDADESAEEIVLTAIEAFKKRNQEKIDINIPEEKNKVIAGFSQESLMDIFSKIEPDDPLQVLTQALESRELKGICTIVGCNNVKVPQDQNHLTIAKKLVQNDILVLSTGCAAQAFAKHGFLTSEAVEDFAGPGLKKFLNRLSDATECELPLIFHMGSCVDNSRPLNLKFALADKLGVDISDLPVAASAPEPMHEKAISIGTWAVTLGLPTHVGVIPYVRGSRLVTEVVTKIAEDVFGGYFIFETDPEAAADKLIDAIEERAWKLRVRKEAKKAH